MRSRRLAFSRTVGAPLLVAVLALFVTRSAAAPAPTAAPLPDGLYAEFTTPRGVTVVELFYTQAPLMCANFTGLAEGTLAPRNGKPFYTGLTWYRVVPGFVIQSGNPGLKDTDDEKTPIPHRFPDEFVPGLRHDAAGVLSMANAGPDTNSCEFFLTLAPTQRLNYLHSVFGRTVRGVEVLPQIRQNDPVSIKILRIGAAARAFKNDPAAFAALGAQKKKYTASREPGPGTHFADTSGLIPTEPPRAKNFNYKLANLERTTGLRIVAELRAKSPPPAEDAEPGAFMRALARKVGTADAGALAVYFADDKEWRVWIGDTLAARFVGRPGTAAEFTKSGLMHEVKEAFLAAAQKEGDAAFAAQTAAAAAAQQPAPPPAQHLKLHTDALLDALIVKLEPKP